MNIDFAAVLVFLTFLSGFIWLFDNLVFSAKRKAIAIESGGVEKTPETPLMVDYAKSFFPIFLFVLILRSFIAEPFRIPSASMMPTLLIGDFILVNKYDYGIRLPVLNTLVYRNKTPERGDIIVFRYPEDPSIPYIKRVVGLPGDHITYYDKTLFINGKPVEQEDLGKYVAMGSGKMMDGASLRLENLESVTHEILVDLERYSRDVEGIVPENHYFVLGDNRDNSKDSRYWGFVPDNNLIGRAFLIWMNWDTRNGGIEWGRIGTILK
ncbi:MAG: signal peptidase I [Gammaproteobacteria bacterium RIFCSPLOWO2_01_FULL_47_190]|nr:MAG: signal peptidase I [Gammaproteobacteria bacterium RIFCSPLOWO2_01_FULL_47_190]OGT85229.1 MAG: signal peptidase I [Gammaproteobacteria bacterium RIFCSPLOWO2_12_FULL_47_76]